jgi:hypothetical protein
MTTSDNNKDDQENNIGNDEHDGRRGRRPTAPETKEVNNNNICATNHKNNHNTRPRTTSTSTSVKKKKKKKTTTKPAVVATSSRNRILRLLLQGTIHFFCIGLYLIPILTPNEFAGPTLDEAHVMSGDIQKDIHDPDASWKQIFSNDYWGRPMNSPSSHKSWRPLTILSFRYLKGPYIDLATQSIQQLTVHRFVNAILHATIGDLVGQLATQLSLIETLTSRRIISQQHQLLGLQLITKVIFCLHPTHVEVTANAANRNHLLAVLFGVILCFPGRRASSIRSAGALIITPAITTPFWLFLLAMLMGYLASETFLFMIPGVMVTMTVIAFTTNTNININTTRTNQNQNDKQHNQTGTTPTSATRSSSDGHDNDSEDEDNVHASSSSQTNNDSEDNDNDDNTLGTSSVFSLKRFVYDYLRAILSIAPRLILVAASVFIYYCARWYYDTLDIPTGLIRPAESPYYEFTGIHRIRNYLYVVTIHLGKQWGSILPKQFGGDPIGFSHEYGYDCVPEIKQWDDVRLVFGVGFHIFFAILLSLVLVIYNPRKFFGLVAIHWSWTLGTLFPIFGIVKVGTFISDRIVVPSTVVVSIWMGKLVYTYATDWIWNKRLPFVYFRPLQFVFILWWTIISYLTVHNRSLDWMDSISLMKSSLVTCPRFAKVHMEVSKIYSGLYPTMFDLKTSRFHLDTAREIDPNLCDLHKQYVYVALQENKYLEVEQELPQALLCSFTAGGTEQLWNNYWNQLLSAAPKGTRQHADIETRYKTALSIVQTGIQKERDREREQQYYNDMVE